MTVSRISRALGTAVLVVSCSTPRAPPPPPPEEVPDANPIDAGGASLVSVEGVVERSTSGGEWTVATAGEILRASDRVRTGADGKAGLSLAGDSHVTVQGASEVSVLEVDKAVRRLGLRAGRIRVRHKPGGERVLKVETPKGQVVTATRGDFAAQVSDSGFAVAALQGQVKVASAGVDVVVPQGQQAVAQADRPPSVAAPIPKEVLLKVARSASSKGVCAAVRGTVSPGASVRVAGVPVKVDAEGLFSHTVAAAPGRTSVVVATVDAQGRVKERTVACRRPERTAPAESGLEGASIQWGP